MRPLTVLVTNITLSGRTGTEIVVRDLALGLKARGHTPIIYSPQLGPLAEELLTRTVPVINDLSRVGIPPDVIHGHHTAETTQAMLRFPGTPALFVCHDWSAWYDSAPLCPLVRQYLAVDDTCRDRLVCRDGVPPAQVRVLGNAVDLDRFRRREPLAAVPKRAVVFSNTVTHDDVLPAIEEGCRRVGVTLDRLGGPHSVPDPETRLQGYDVVFARGRSALEAMACGAAVVLADTFGFGGLVTRSRAEALRRLNFGRRALVDTPVTAERVADALRQYDPADTAAVTDFIRQVASLDDWLDQLVTLYREAISKPVTAGERESLLRLAADAVELAMPHTRMGRERWAELDRDRAEVARAWHAAMAANQRAREQWELSVAADERRREQLSGWQRQEQQLRAEAEATRREVDDSRRLADALGHEVERLAAEIAQCQRSSEQLAAEVATTHHESTQLLAEIAHLQSELARRHTELVVVRQSATESHHRSEALGQEIATLRQSTAVRFTEWMRRLPIVSSLFGRGRPGR